MGILFNSDADGDLSGAARRVAKANTIHVGLTFMHRVLLAAALTFSFVQAASSAESPPLDCPYCGTWTISTASPSGSTGEQIVASQDRISLPTCGEFSITLKGQQHSTVHEQRTYKSTLELKPIRPDPLCSVEPGESLRLEIVVSVGYKADGGIGEFSVHKEQAPNPILSARAWNYSRDDPCGSGSAYGSIACLQNVNARLIKTFSYEAYSAQLGRRGRSNFNAARYAATTMDFCSKREAENGGGSWPYFWALDCHAGLLQTKLAELRRWAACQSESKRPNCKPLNEKFDMSPKKEE